MKKYQKIEIHWIDSTSHDDWVDLEEALKYEMENIISTGFFLQDKNECVYIARTLQIEDNEVTRVEGVLLIPKNCIKKII